MATVELHGAFVWDCDGCGKENFERAVEGYLDEAALESDPGAAFGELLMPEPEDGPPLSELLIQRVLLVPRRVVCRACGERHETEVPTCEDDGDE